MAQNHHWGLLTVLGGQPCAHKGAYPIPASLQSLLPTSAVGWGATRGLPVWYSAWGGMWRQRDPVQHPAPGLNVFLSSPGLQGCLAKARSGRKTNQKKKEKEAALKIAPLATVPGNGLGHMGKRLRAGSGGEGSGASSCPPCCCLNRGWLGCGAALPCQLHPRLTELLA